jgi:hypothetical protein
MAYCLRHPDHLTLLCMENDLSRLQRRLTEYVIKYEYSQCRQYPDVRMNYLKQLVDDNVSVPTEMDRCQSYDYFRKTYGRQLRRMLRQSVVFTDGTGTGERFKGNYVRIYVQDPDTRYLIYTWPCDHPDL